MSKEIEIKNQILDWVAQKGQSIQRDDIDEGTKILEKKMISSLQVMELILFLGKIKGGPVQMENVKPGSFSSVNSIYNSFFGSLA
jgi:acyl carrier protein